MGARKFNLELKYENNDISKEVGIFLESFKYVDRATSDKMDEISVTFQDVAGLWRNGWFPKRGAKFSAKLRATDWFNQGDFFERNCGKFEIDDLKSSGFPSVFSVSAVSVGITSGARWQENTIVWENIDIKTIASDLALINGFELKWYSDYNPIIERWEQKSESDLSCLRKICEYAGLTFKITNELFVIFNAAEFDQKKPEKKIRISGDGVQSYDFNANSSGIYAACEVMYLDPDTTELLAYLFYPDGVSGVKGGKKKDKKEKTPKTISWIQGEKKGESQTRMVVTKEISQPEPEEKEPEIKDPEVGNVLKINKRCKSLAEAEAVAKAALRNENMQMLQGSLSLMGRPDLFAGMNIELEGFGIWDSVVWSIEEVTHDWSKSSGYNTSIAVRGILGY
jgi:uncharacterized protein